MSKKYRARMSEILSKRLKKRSSGTQQVQYLLERGTLKDMRAAKAKFADLVSYDWSLYFELALQRSQIQDQLKQSLIQTCQSNFEFKNWQRAVKYRYSLHPLSTVGSLSFVGGRFNTGIGVNSEVPSFPCLYIAENKDTALQEHLGQAPVEENCKLTPRELALTNPTSESIVSMSGKMDKVLDLRNVDSVKPFLNLIASFVLSTDLRKQETRLKIEPAKVIMTAEQLIDSLLDPNWRDKPTHGDVPANSQIFGHLVRGAGIEGIVYPSKFTADPCIAIYPQNLRDTDSFVQLDDEPPHPHVSRRLDSASWRVSELSFEEISRRTTIQ
jgi:hypothetical protein